MAKQDVIMLNDRKFRMLRVKQILERETDATHSITMTRLLELMNEDVESDRRTLYDDIRKLEKLGTKVKIDKSKTPPHLSVTERQFTLSELKLMIDAIASSKYLTKSASQELIDKLKGFCSRYEAAELNRQTLIANRAKRVDEEFHNNVGIISQAIDQKKKISFDYFRISTSKKKDYNKKETIVSPWASIYADDNYYMVGYTQHTYSESTRQTYRIDRMTNVKILNEDQDGEQESKKFKDELPFRTQSTFNLFGGEKEFVTLRCPNYYFYVIQDKFGPDVIAHPIKGTDSCTVNVPVAVGDAFFGWVFGMGERIKIVGPESVKEKMREMISKAAKSYR